MRVFRSAFGEVFRRRAGSQEGLGRRFDESRLQTLGYTRLVREAEIVLFMGPPRVGKSHLTVALRVKAIKSGFSTTHFLLDDLTHVLKGDAASEASIRR